MKKLQKFKTEFSLNYYLFLFSRKLIEFARLFKEIMTLLIKKGSEIEIFQCNHINFFYFIQKKKKIE